MVDKWGAKRDECSQTHTQCVCRVHSCISHRCGRQGLMKQPWLITLDHISWKRWCCFAPLVTRSAKKASTPVIGWQAAVCVATAARDQVHSSLASSGVSCGKFGNICEHRWVASKPETPFEQSSGGVFKFTWCHLGCSCYRGWTCPPHKAPSDDIMWEVLRLDVEREHIIASVIII